VELVAMVDIPGKETLMVLGLLLVMVTNQDIIQKRHWLWGSTSIVALLRMMLDQLYLMLEQLRYMVSIVTQ